MDTTLETLDGDRVKLTVAVDETEFDAAVDAAFKRIAKEVRLPGFRPGKAPRKLLEARIGVAAGRQEALQQALPDYYGRALAENEVDAIDQPEIEITGGAEDGPLTFDAVVPVRPRAAVAGHGSLRVEIQAIEASDDEITEQLEAIRRQHATLADADRPADDGDHVTIDIEGSVDGEAVEGLTTSDYLYEVGAGAVVPEIDENLRGATAGDTLEFDADHPEEDDAKLSFRIEVKAGKAVMQCEHRPSTGAQNNRPDKLANINRPIFFRLGIIDIHMIGQDIYPVKVLRFRVPNGAFPY